MAVHLSRQQYWCYCLHYHLFLFYFYFCFGFYFSVFVFCLRFCSCRRRSTYTLCSINYETNVVLGIICDIHINLQNKINFRNFVCVPAVRFEKQNQIIVFKKQNKKWTLSNEASWGQLVFSFCGRVDKIAKNTSVFDNFNF